MPRRGHGVDSAPARRSMRANSAAANGEKTLSSTSAQPSATGAQKLPPTANSACGTSLAARRTAGLARSKPIELHRAPCAGKRREHRLVIAAFAQPASTMRAFSAQGPGRVRPARGGRGRNSPPAKKRAARRPWPCRRRVRRVALLDRQQVDVALFGKVKAVVFGAAQRAAKDSQRPMAHRAAQPGRTGGVHGCAPSGAGASGCASASPSTGAVTPPCAAMYSSKLANSVWVGGG